MVKYDESLAMRALVIDDEVDDETAAGRALRRIADDLRARDVEIVTSASSDDACAIVAADAGLECVILDWDLGKDGHEAACTVLQAIRTRNTDMPVFLLAERSTIASVPAAVMEQTDDFIWLLENTPDFISGRVVAAIRRYQAGLLPPMFGALCAFSDVHEYSWHTPGHAGGIAFLKSPVGRTFFSFFGENLLRADLSVSVGELGSLLDHSGPIGKGEKNAARIFGADRTYFVTNGTSTANRVVVMATVTRGDVVLCDRNCHKSIEHAMTLSGAIPTYLVPSRNHLGIIGPVHADLLAPSAIDATIAGNRLAAGAACRAPKLAILTNSTYDGLCYNIERVEESLGTRLDRLLFDEAWYGYARFNPLYRGRFAMRDEPVTGGPSVFATQSTHKLLAALSQASMIHVREGRNPVPHDRFNEAFMMHASTSPQYAIIASNDVSAAMMDGAGGRALTNESIHEAVAFRRLVARLRTEFAEHDDWFFDLWQPRTVPADGASGTVPLHAASAEQLAQDPRCWMLAPGAAWHGFGQLEEGYCMLDPIKVSVVTPGAASSGGRDDVGIPAALLSAYLDNRGIIPEKTSDFTVLFLFSLGITKGKSGTLVNALLEFKRDYDANAPLLRILPRLVSEYPARYGTMGLRDLAREMYAAMQRLKTMDLLERGFASLPEPDVSPVDAYEALVRNEVERLAVAAMAGRTLATGIVPYPPGIPLLMPGENAGSAGGAVLSYLGALEAFDRTFPGFAHDIHGIETIGGVYYALCLRTATTAR